MIPDPRLPFEKRRAATEVVEGTAHLFKPDKYGLPPFKYDKVI